MKKGKKRLLFAASALLLCTSPFILTNCSGKTDVGGPGGVTDTSKLVSEFTVSLSSTPYL